MSKDTFYFQHDYHARKDPKCQALISEYGITAYGMYWSLIEIMHEQGGKIKKFPRLYEGLAFEFGIEKELLVKQIEAMLHDFELLVQDDDYIWSERVLFNLKEREAKKMLRVEAGKLGGIKSGVSRLNRSKSKQCLKQNEANEAKERKGKEIKEKNIKTFLSDSVEVGLSELLFQKIISRNPKFKKPNIQLWAKDISMMMTADTRAPDDIQKVIVWCQDDSFWQNNILSAGKLRKQFDQLYLKMQQTTQQGVPWYEKALQGS
jgi:hypothetical protein